MQDCQKILKDILPPPFQKEKKSILNIITMVLVRLIQEEQVKLSDIKTLPDGMDSLLLMDEWRLVQPVGRSATKAWEDVSQLILSKKDLGLKLPPWIKGVFRMTCEKKGFNLLEAITMFLADEEDPTWNKIPPFLYEMARRAEFGVIDAQKILQLLRKRPLNISADTLIARLKNYGFISPHLRADFFRMRSPHYEIHPLLVYYSSLKGTNKEKKVKGR